MKKLFKNSIFIILVVIWLAMPVMASSITPPDDHGNSFKEATEIDLPIKNLKGEISYPGDKDYFKFITTMERKISYAFRTQAGEIELYDENLTKSLPMMFYRHGIHIIL